MIRRRWPDCNAVRVLESGGWDLPPITITCSKPVLHLGKHHDYYWGFAWTRDSLTDDAAVARLLRVKARS